MWARDSDNDLLGKHGASLKLSRKIVIAPHIYVAHNIIVAATIPVYMHKYFFGSPSATQVDSQHHKQTKPSQYM